MESEVLMELAMRLLMFFVGMGLSMLGIMVALSSQHMVIGVLILCGGFVLAFGSFTPRGDI